MNRILLELTWDPGFTSSPPLRVCRIARPTTTRIDSLAEAVELGGVLIHAKIQLHDESVMLGLSYCPIVEQTVGVYRMDMSICIICMLGLWWLASGTDNGGQN